MIIVKLFQDNIFKYNVKVYNLLSEIVEILEVLDDKELMDEIKKLLSKFSVELNALEDAYVTSRYVLGVIVFKEANRLKKVIEEIKRIVEEIIS